MCLKGIGKGNQIHESTKLTRKQSDLGVVKTEFPIFEIGDHCGFSVDY